MTLPYLGCEREVIFQQDTITLYRYRSLLPDTHAVPLLMVFALVNRPTILDLQPDISLIRQLLQRGLDIYLLDWGYPTEAQSAYSLADYIDGHLKHSVACIRRRTHCPKINLLGICQGGVFSLCFASLYPQYIKNLILMVTPVHFHTKNNRITALTRYIDVTLLHKKYPLVPGIFLAQFMLSLKPYALTIGKAITLTTQQDDRQKRERFLRVEQWLADNPDQVGGALAEFISQCYQKNALVKGGMRLANKVINLANVTMPVLNILAKQDHIVPLSAGRALKKYIKSTDYTVASYDTGHIGIYISYPMQQIIPNKISEWVKSRE